MVKIQGAIDPLLSPEINDSGLADLDELVARSIERQVRGQTDLREDQPNGQLYPVLEDDASDILSVSTIQVPRGTYPAVQRNAAAVKAPNRLVPFHGLLQVVNPF